MEKNLNLSFLIKLVTGILILASIVLTYYVMIIKNDYNVFTNPDGPELELE